MANWCAIFVAIAAVLMLWHSAPMENGLSPEVSITQSGSGMWQMVARQDLQPGMPRKLMRWHSARTGNGSHRVVQTRRSKYGSQLPDTSNARYRVTKVKYSLVRSVLM